MSVVYVLTTPIPEDGENATVDQIKRRNKWDSDDYVCRGLIIKDIGGSVVLEEVTEEVVTQQPELKLRKSKRNTTPKNFGPGFQLYLTEGTRDEVSDQHSYCFNVDDDPKIFDEAIKSHYVAFWKKAINDEMDSVDRTIKKFKARLVIQGFRQKSGIDYFDTYAPVARFSTIRLPIALASIHSLIIHQMDVKKTFLNGVLDEEIYMNQPWGFIIPGNENKVDLTKEFLSSRLSMKDMGEDDVILGIRINIKVIELQFLSLIILRRPDIAFAMGKLSRYTSNPGTQHWQVIQRVLKYLKKTMDYSLTYIGYPLVLEGYTDASWIKNVEDNSSTSGLVFLLGGSVISWASKKQTCITGSTIEYEFMALAAAG
ncbi:zinc finger, CCHC-type containing protein [Tanacetum coccineum]